MIYCTKLQKYKQVQNYKLGCYHFGFIYDIWADILKELFIPVDYKYNILLFIFKV